MPPDLSPLLSGEQVEIVLGSQRAAVTTVGATLRTYAVAGRPVLDGFPADEVCPGGCGQVLVPWPNRIAGGRYSFAGNEYQLPIDEPELGHAIHGLCRWAEWQIAERSEDAARLSHRLWARRGYPFVLDLSIGYRLSPSGLVVELRATNAGQTPCPFGAGAHPYLVFAGVPADALELSVPAKAWLEVDERSIPRGRRPVEGSALDFRTPRAIGPAHLDHCYADLERDATGSAEVLLRHGADQIRVWLDRAFDFVQVYTGDTLSDPVRWRRSIAVEPMTCAPNAFNSGDGLRVLAPGESLEARWGISVS